MMWHVLFNFISILRNIHFPLTAVKGKTQCMLYNILADYIRTVKRGYNSVERKVPNQRKPHLLFNGVFVTYEITILTHEISNILSDRHMYGTKWL